MFRVLLPPTLTALLLGATSATSAPLPPEDVASAWAVIETRLANLATTVLRADRTKFVNYTDATGAWRIQTSATWTSGFVPGLFWQLYQRTGETIWKERAEHWTTGMSSRATAADNDTGFQIFCSFGLGYLSTGSNNADYLSTAFTGAQTLVTQRFNPTIGCFRSWQEKLSDPDTMPFEVNIDQMMNLELPLWVASRGGPAEYVDKAIQHADTSWTNNVRADGGTFHVVEYGADGAVVKKRNAQGWTTNSTWSRGQAWAVYGYTMVYRYTGLPRMLERAQVCFDYFWNQTNADRTDAIPFSDFDAPLDNKNPRDTSAAAIVASAALELFTITGETRYREAAETILASLISDTYLGPATTYQSILLAGSEKHGLGEVGAIFGDYYLVEALRRYEALPTGETWAGFPVTDGIADTGAWLGLVYTGAKPWIYAYDLAGWLYLEEGMVSAHGAWAYLLRP